jgi:hypothetical protein
MNWKITGSPDEPGSQASRDTQIRRVDHTEAEHRKSWYGADGSTVPSLEP